MSWNNYLDPNSSNGEHALLQQAWNKENDDLFSSWFNPGSQQQEEFAQQIVLQQMQNQWNSEAERLERMKAAGINVNTAAAGIAGAGASPSTGSPNSAVGAGAQGAASAAQVAGSIGDLLTSGVNAYEKISKTPVEVEQSRANIRNLLSSALHNDWLAYSISEMLPLQKANERADTYLKMANFEKAKEERLLINKRISEVEENIGVLKEQARLYHEQGDLVKYQEYKTFYEGEVARLDSDKKQWEKDWREKYKYDPNSPVDVALEQAMVNGAGDEVVNAIGDSIKDVSYSHQKGFNQAEVEDAFDKAFNSTVGVNEANADYAEYFADVDAWKSIFVEMWKAAIENPSDIQGVIAKGLNSIANILSSAQIGYNRNIKPKSRPHVAGKHIPVRE